MFGLGQKAYGKRMYGRSFEFLEDVLTIIPRQTLFGGEIQLWLAMAYEANNRHADCIALYKQLEQKHPVSAFGAKQQTLDTFCKRLSSRYLKRRCNAVTWSDKYKDKDDRRSGSTTNQLPPSRDFIGDVLVWQPPILLDGSKNRAFWVALTLWFGLVGAFLILQR